MGQGRNIKKEDSMILLAVLLAVVAEESKSSQQQCRILFTPLVIIKVSSERVEK